MSQDSYYDALKLMGKATYKYSHFDERMEIIQHRYVPKSVEAFAAYTAPIVTLVMEHRVKFAWSFP